LSIVCKKVYSKIFICHSERNAVKPKNPIGLPCRHGVAGAIILERSEGVRHILSHIVISFQTLRSLSFIPNAPFLVISTAVEKSCDFSRIRSHVILEALAEEVRGSTLFTTFLPLPCGQRFLGFTAFRSK
jgi:hypothetical protein